MPTIFWDAKEILLISPCIKEERRGKLVLGILVYQDNAPVHKSFVSLSESNNGGLELMDHPPYSPDLGMRYFLVM